MMKGMVNMWGTNDNGGCMREDILQLAKCSVRADNSYCGEDKLHDRAAMLTTGVASSASL